MSLVQGGTNIRRHSSLDVKGETAADLPVAENTFDFRQALTMSAPQCEDITNKIGEGFDATLARILVDFKLGRLQQSQKRFRALLTEKKFSLDIPLIEQDTRFSQATAPLLIFELLFLLSYNANPPAEEVWRYFETISWFDPDDVICHGAVYNLLLILFLRRTDLVAAEELAKLALSAYAQCDSPYLKGFVFLHLAFTHFYAGRLDDVKEDLVGAKQTFSQAGDAICELAMVEITQLWLEAERSGIMPEPETLANLKEDLLSGGFWPETILVFANMQFRTELRRNADNALLLHSALEAVLRARGMTQVLPAMQLLREEFMMPTKGANVGSHSKPLELSERQLILLSPNVEALTCNWGPTFLKEDLRLPRMRALQAITRGESYLSENRFDLAAPQFLSGLNIIEKYGCMLLLASVRETVSVFLRECSSRRRFVSQARHYQNALMAGLCNSSEGNKRPVELTTAEFGVLSQLPVATSNKSMARDLGVSERTIKFHLSNIYRKLGVKTRRDAVKIASAKGWISLDH